MSDFEKTATRLNEIESLQSQGLSGSEISLRLDPESRRLPDDVVQRHLRDIETKLHSTVEARTVSRRQREALTVKPQSEETRLLQFALQSGLGERIEDVAGHPMTQLQEMEKNLFGHLERKATPGLAKRRKRMRKAEGVERHISSYGKKRIPSWKIQIIKSNRCKVFSSIFSGVLEIVIKKFEFPERLSILSPYRILEKMIKRINNISPILISVPDVKQSKWDVKEVPLTPTRLCKTFLEKANPEPLNNAQKVYTCKPQQLFTIVDGKIVKLDNKDESQRLTLNEIRDLPHFRNYEQGNPSKVKM